MVSKELEQQLKGGDRNTLNALAKYLEASIQDCREKLDTAQDKDVLIYQGMIKGHKRILDTVKVNIQ